MQKDLQVQDFLGIGEKKKFYTTLTKIKKQIVRKTPRGLEPCTPSLSAT